MKTVLKLIFGFMIVIFLIVIIGYFTIIQLQNITMPLLTDIPHSIQEISTQSQLDGDAQLIKYYDEVLTQSARNYAFTQDKKWEERYKAIEPELDKTIKDAITEGDKTEKEFFSSVDKANLALVEMEYKSIDFVNNGQASEAVKILESDDYWKQKKIYEQGLRDYVAKRGAQYDEAFVASTDILEKANKDTQELINRTTELIVVFIVLVLTTVVVSGFLITRSINVISIAESKYKDLYENSPTLLATIDKNGTILQCNNRFVNRLGYTKTELIGKSIFMHIVNSIFETQPIAPTSNEFLPNLQKNGFVVDLEVIFKRKDNTKLPTLISANYSNIVKDNIDLEIKDSTETYFSKLLHTEDALWLQFHYDELAKSAKTKDEFLAMITHELKTPLVPIKGYVDLLLQDKLGLLTESQKQKLKVVKDNTDSLYKLITQLLESQKIGLEQLKIQKSLVDLSELVNDTILEIKPTTSKHGITLDSEIERSISCLCDKNRIKEVLINLFTNAIDFCTNENSKIQVKLSKETNKAKIVVKDNGKGISPKNLDKLFTKFYQVDVSRTREHGGSGLGLAICQGIVEAHGGRIFAKSEEGKGSEFHVELPLN